MKDNIGRLEKEVIYKCPNCKKPTKFKLIDLFGEGKRLGFYECNECGQNVTSKYLRMRR